MLEYESAYRRLPAIADKRFFSEGRWDLKVPDNEINKPTGWRFAILPFLEEVSIYKTLQDYADWRFSKRERSATPDKPMAVSYFKCPSDSEPSLLELGQVTNRRRSFVLFDATHPPDCMAPVGIRGMPGTTSLDPAAPGAWRAGTGYGVVSHDTGAELKRVTDGLSKTVLVAERAGGSFFRSDTETPVAMTPHHAWIYVDQIWMAVPPNRPAINRNNMSGVFSFHDGAHVAMCDGSVRFLSEDIEPKELATLFSRNDGL